MNTISWRSVFVAAVVSSSSSVWAQQKYQVTQAPASTSQYVQQHAIDVNDARDHQIRVYEIRFEYPKKDLSFAGVLVKESYVRGMSDYVGLSGPFTVYSVYTLEDGNRVFSRSTGTSLLTTGTDGKAVVKFSAVENYVGGTGRFKGIRGQVHNIGEREVVAKTITQKTSGEYWIEE